MAKTAECAYTDNYCVACTSCMQHVTGGIDIGREMQRKGEREREERTKISKLEQKPLKSCHNTEDSSNELDEERMFGSFVWKTVEEINIKKRIKERMKKQDKKERRNKKRK